MSKKVLVLSSTPRKGGNSDVLCDKFAQGAKEIGHSVEKINLREQHINYCTGCGACTRGLACPQKDDAAEVIQKMIDADVIAMATPVYFYTICAQMKTLIDRCCARYTEISNKDFYFFITAADGRQATLERTLEDFRGFTDCLNGANEKGVILGSGVWQIGEIAQTSFVSDAYEMGKGC